MNQPAGARAWQARQIDALLADPRSREALIAAATIPDAKLTYAITTPTTYTIDGRQTRLTVKIPGTDAAAAALEAEGRLLLGLRRMPLGGLAETIPRHVTTLRVDGRPVLVTTAMPGTPLSNRSDRRMHIARPGSVGQDFTLAARWLSEFQGRTAGQPRSSSWAEEVVEGVRGRWDGHELLDDAAALLAPVVPRLSEHPVPPTAVHGDLWGGRLLVDDLRVSGVVDWEGGAVAGNPLRDLTRFALGYCLRLDRHTRKGHAVAGHPRLPRTGPAPGLRYGLLGRGWLPNTVRCFLADGLQRLGLSRSLWYAAAVAGIGEVAAFADDVDLAGLHLELLATLPTQP